MLVSQILHEWEMRLLRRVIAVTWEPDEAGFWILLEPNELRRIGVDGTVSPLYTLAGLTEAEQALWSQAGQHSARYARAPILELEDDGKLHVYFLGEHIVDTRALPKVVGAISPVAVDAVRILETPRNSPRSARILKDATTRFALPDLSEAGISAALAAMTGRLDAMLAPRDYIRPAFLTPDSVLDERAFFALIRERCPGAVPALRTLILTYAAKVRALGRSHIFYATDEEVAFGHAALALAHLDADCGTILIAFLQDRRAEHDPFTRDAVLATYHRRHGWTGEPGMRLGIAYASSESFGGGLGIEDVWQWRGLREAAQGMPVETVAALILGQTFIAGRQWAVAEIRQGWIDALSKRIREPTRFELAVCGALRSQDAGEH
jgi:hypothetical protein